MKFSIVLAVAALLAETFACANIGQVCQKGDPDVCHCPAEVILFPGLEAVSAPVDGSTAIFSVPVRILLIQVARRFHYQLGDICPLLKRNGQCVNGKCVPGPRLTAVTPTPTPE
ncbi:hypothetical protein LZL87_012002 [Fusarium oxysporum]|nr:hypothetical protein LZL87_012002 [Fusarium oxysporum]